MELSLRDFSRTVDISCKSPLCKHLHGVLHDILNPALLYGMKLTTSRLDHGDGSTKGATVRIILDLRQPPKDSTDKGLERISVK